MPGQMSTGSEGWWTTRLILTPTPAAVGARFVILGRFWHKFPRPSTRIRLTHPIRNSLQYSVSPTNRFSLAVPLRHRSPTSTAAGLWP